MSLSQLLFKSHTLFHPALPVSKDFNHKIQQIHERWPDVVVEVPERDRELVMKKLLALVQSWEWDEVKMSFICSGAPIVFNEDFRAREIFSPLQQFYLRETELTDSSSFLSAMMAAYIRSYQPGAEHTRKLSQSLTLAKENMGAKWRDILAALPELLDPQRAHIALATKMVTMDSPWQELRNVGIVRPHEPGVMSFAHQAYVELLSPDLDQKVVIEKLFDWLKPEGRAALMFGAAETINALLAPWIKTQPDERLSRYLTDKLVELYGDPRLGLGGIWGGVEEACRNTIINWLTRENILFFLDVVSDVEDSHMWEPRRKFWLGLYNQEKITSAWVAFSDQAAFHARAIKRSMKDASTLSFGSQTARGSRTNTSLLILRIGDCIVVEGSHNYKVHIFRINNDKAPQLFQLGYDCDTIRWIPDSISIPHLGQWQSKVLEQIEYLS